MSNKFDYHLIVIHILIYKILYLHVENVYNFLHYYYYYCKGRFWILSPKGRWIKGQRAQYNEFIESGLKTELQWIGQRS